MQSNSLTKGFYVYVGLLLVLHSIPVVEDILAVVHIPVVDTREEASAALQIRIVTAHADQDVSHPHLLIAAQVVVLLLVVRMAAPGYSSVSPSFVPGYPRQ